MAVMIVPIPVTDAMFVSSTVAEPDAGAGETVWASGTSYTIGQRAARTGSGVHKLFESLRGESHSVTISNGSPAVITWAGHGKAAGQAISFTTTGALPTGLSVGVTYYVVNPGADSFQVSLTVGGTAVNTSSAGSGTHTAVLSTNLGNTPESSPLHWVEVQATNRWAPFDSRITSTATDGSPITYILEPGVPFDSIGLAGLVGVTDVHLLVEVAGQPDPIHDVTYDLDATVITDWEEWLFAADELRRSYAILGIQGWAAATVTLTFTGPADIGVGMILIGKAKNIGKMTYQPRIGITDYSTKETDTWGNVVIQERGFSRTLEGRLEIDNSAVESVRRALEAVRATPVMVVGVLDHDQLTEPLTVVGFYREFQIEVAYPTKSLATLSMEGLVQA